MIEQRWFEGRERWRRPGDRDLFDPREFGVELLTRDTEARALRRSATDRLIEGGAAPGTEASHLGHSPAIALTNYHKPRDLALDQAAELLDDLDRPAGLRTVLTWTAEEWALVEAAAGRLGQDPAEWARRLLLAAAAPPAPSTPTPTRGRSRSRSRHTPGTV